MVKSKIDKTMKQKIKFLAILIVLGLFITSCNKWIDPDINKNPDAPSEVTMATLLPSIIANIGYTTYGGTDAVMVTNLWIQYLAGTDRQAASYDNYDFRAGDCNNLWNSNYSSTMMDIKKFIEYAKAKNSPYNEGIGKILMAISLGATTTLWGDIPYSEAFLGADNLTPKFDKQEDIYKVIQQLLTDAIADLSKNASENEVDVVGDLIFDGDVDKWIAAAYSLKARYALHLSEVNGNAAFTEASGYLANALTANADNCEIIFGTSPTSAHPFFQFMDQRGDVRMGKFFIDLMKTTNDPRIAVFAEQVGGDYVGSAPGEGNTSASKPGAAVSSMDSKTKFITYSEVLFIKAECEFKVGTEANAKQALKDAVAASLDEYGVINAAWKTAFDGVVDGLSGNNLYLAIMLQKYIALFYQLESFNDWRRTNNVIGLVKNSFVPDAFPNRFPYPMEELSFNPNTPANVKLQDKIWWDK